MEQNFDYNNLPVRTLTDGNEETWFAGIDVCNILEYADSNQAIDKLDVDERKLNRVKHGSGQSRKTWMVNEFGLYSLILSSRKPEAKAFKRWITHEILPSIRKAGKFTSEQEKEHELSLQALAKNIQALKKEAIESQLSLNQLRITIKEKEAKLITVVQMDRSQLKLDFHKKGE